MATLPLERWNFALLFTITGVDFAMPFHIKALMLKSPTPLKNEVTVFVCFTTKPVHLELCINLTTETFRAAFTHFFGRRDFPSILLDLKKP